GPRNVERRGAPPARPRLPREGEWERAGVREPPRLASAASAESRGADQVVAPAGGRPTVNALKLRLRKFSLDSEFHQSLWFQQMLKHVEQTKHAEIRRDPTTSGSAASGASPEGEGVGGERRRENSGPICGLSDEVPSRRAG